MSNFTLWRLHWTGSRGVWSIAGEFRFHRDLEHAKAQLASRYPNAEFRGEYLGRNKFIPTHKELNQAE